VDERASWPGNAGSVQGHPPQGIKQLDGNRVVCTMWCGAAEPFCHINVRPRQQAAADFEWGRGMHSRFWCEVRRSLPEAGPGRTRLHGEPRILARSLGSEVPYIKSGPRAAHVPGADLHPPQHYWSEPGD